MASGHRAAPSWHLGGGTAPADKIAVYGPMYGVDDVQLPDARSAQTQAQRPSKTLFPQLEHARCGIPAPFRKGSTAKQLLTGASSSHTPECGLVARSRTRCFDLAKPTKTQARAGQDNPRASSSAERPRHQRHRGCGESSMLILAPLDSPIGPSCPAACPGIRASWPGDGRQRSPFTPCYHPRLTVQLFACRCLRGGSPCIRTVCTPAAHLDSTDAPS
jgi:hypothetical protein